MPLRNAASEREEAFHRAVLRITRGLRLSEQAARAFLDSGLRPAAEELKRARPYLSTATETVLAEELAASLAAGDWARLGLSAAQAETARRDFVDVLVAEHGEQAREIENYVRQGHSPHHAGSAARDRGGEAPRRVVSEPDGDSGGSEGPRFRPAESSLFGPGDEERTGNLFDATSSDEVAAEQARDRDRLERERLTTQLNAPLTRAEQLKKLKRSQDQPQTDLFEELHRKRSAAFSRMRPVRSPPTWRRWA